MKQDHLDMLEIEGHQYPVLKYTVPKGEPGELRYYAILKLTPEEFDAFEKLLSKDTVHAKRIGIDHDPLESTLGTRTMFWSRHEDNGVTYYKYVVRLFPVSYQEPGLAHALGLFAFEGEHHALGLNVLTLTTRFEALLQMLTDSKAITAEQKAKLLSSDWKDLADQSRADQFTHDVMRVSDAEDFFL